jgi:hypothetical protein
MDIGISGLKHMLVDWVYLWENAKKADMICEEGFASNLEKTQNLKHTDKVENLQKKRIVLILVFDCMFC